jgi:hypothetical protein
MRTETASRRSFRRRPNCLRRFAAKISWSAVGAASERPKICSLPLLVQYLEWPTSHRTRQSGWSSSARGAIPFLDEAQVDAGADFEEDILDFLQRAHELVVLLTPWALERPYVWAEIGAAWGRRIPIVALLLGITAAELQTRPGIPVLLKKRDLLELNDIELYLAQLGARVEQEG